MITEEEIDDIGFSLEEGGLSHSEIDEYFEHFGIKGMHWGFRKHKTLSNLNRGNNNNNKNEHIGLKIATGIALVAGAAAAGVLIKRHSNIKLSQIRNNPLHNERTRQLIMDQATVKVRNIYKDSGIGNITPNQANRLAALKLRDAANTIRRVGL